jgi:hypothetical protein
MKPENLFKKQKDTWEMYNVQAQDLKIVPDVMQESTSNVDIDRYFLKDLLNGNKVEKITSILDKEYTKEFLKLLKESTPNDSFVVNFKDGDTQVASKNELLSLRVLNLKEIKSIAKANTTENIVERKRQKN